MTRLRLDGCRAEPLSSYLTALAVLRLVSEQKDPDARGWWEKGIFHLDSVLDREGLVEFFLSEYIPTPIVSPWGGGSGFYEGDNTEGMNALLASDSDRFSEYQKAIREIQTFPEMPDVTFPIKELLDQLQQKADKSKGKTKEKYLTPINDTILQAGLVPLLSPDENLLALTIEELDIKATIPRNASQSEKKRANAIKKLIASAKKVRNQIKAIKRGSGKEQIIAACRDRLNDRAVEWIDAALILDPEGKSQSPPILGTGGNEGRLDYSNGFMKNIKGMLLEHSEGSESLLSNALFDDPTEQLQFASVGQYDPGRAGGYNQGAEIETKNFPVNPWTYILTMEGAVSWASSVARRQKSAGGGYLRSPFTVRSTPVGYNSSSDKEDARAEIWAPLWRRPASYREIRLLLSEGRADVGQKSASNGIEFAEAATSLGVDRGITEFVRYSLLKRRGDNYVALPVGRFPVQIRSESDLVRELIPILAKIIVKDDDAPAKLSSARRNVDDAIYTTLLHGGATNVRKLIAAIGHLERIIAQSGYSNKPIVHRPQDLGKNMTSMGKGGYSNKPIVHRPLSGLSPKWILAADDGSIELRIATALASIGATGGVGPIRANIAPVDPVQPWKWSEGRGQTAWEGNSFTARLASVLIRRMMDAEKSGTQSNPLWGSIQIIPDDINAFIEGSVDESRIEDLLFGMTWIKWSDKTVVSDIRWKLRGKNGWQQKDYQRSLPRSFALLKLLFLPGGIEKDGERIIIKPESSIIPLLRAGRINDACTIAGRRLRATGFTPMTTAFPDGDDGLRIASTLLIPMRGERELMKLVLKPEEKNSS
ncbi:MAG: type I-U CRISPR-associated protein Csx17 [Methanocalculus sp. MSAO_Arc2]|uniref:type I-G CRISPR-associated protein Cas8g1/Csx17 n=1 Tax=Methanocalculus sp. MSAO_Arc2 TaxID=2293855 RepID=UPI000FED8147|nr:MAG: type I-U CRISPR-associated protein Csx17 [Methanocalculus sp. MSAO_Arc2]